MKKTSVQKLARVVRVLILIVFVCNLIALLLVPGVSALIADGGIKMLIDAFSAALAKDGTGFISLPAFFVFAWAGIWMDLYSTVMALFLWICGGCTAVILWQVKRVLNFVLKEEPFSFSNARYMRWSAICCFVISAVALAYEVFGLCFYGGEAVFLTFSFMLFFVFLIAGLICLVMSALFRQAAEMKAEQDLTI